MKHRVSHTLSNELARKAADAAWSSYAERFEKYSPTATWTSERQALIQFKVKGISLKGSLELEDGAIAMELDVPLAFRLFKKKALEVVEREITTWVRKAEKGELE